MNKRYRDPLIIGNWKMNKNPVETKDFINEIKAFTSKAKWCKVVLCVPFIDIPAAVKTAKGSKIDIGAQNCHYLEKGAYTGEISCPMLDACGVKYVVIGHSERRRLFNETYDVINKKTLAALDAGLRPIVSVGESVEEREADVTLDVIRTQLKLALKGVDVSSLKRVVIAYEPIWATGTGVTATPEQANEVCTIIRDCLRHIYGARAARAVSIVYGGSIKGKNAFDLMSMPNIDGGLIGAAALEVDHFIEIINAANQ